VAPFAIRRVLGTLGRGGQIVVTAQCRAASTAELELRGIIRTAAAASPLELPSTIALKQ
jgi:hypothetical protein